MGESENEEVAWGGAGFKDIGYSGEFLKCHGGICFGCGVVKESVEDGGWERGGGGGGGWGGGEYRFGSEDCEG